MDAAAANGDLTQTASTEEVTPDDVDVYREKLQRVDELKAFGGERFREGLIEEALKHYEEAIEILDGFDGANGPARAALCSNEALCLLRLERFERAEERAGAALAADPSSSKAAYRRGLARLRLGDATGALDDLQKAMRLEPQNKDVRLRLEEARKLTEAAAISTEEVAVASSAVTALGASKDGGLYAEKPDLNEGRLAETYREQREWIKTISDWKEITDIAFADEDGKISVYMTLPGLHELTSNKICVWLHVTSLEVRVIDLRGTNWCYVAQELYGQIDSEASSWKVRKDKLSLKLQKRASARSWDRWEKLRR